MDVQTVRKTFKYQLNPTLSQERAMGFVLRRCRELYNAALQERRDAWQKCGVRITTASQSAQLPAIKRSGPNTATSTPRCCKMCSRAWTGPFKRSFGE
jgi:hypothetical protein